MNTDLKPANLKQYGGWISHLLKASFTSPFRNLEPILRPYIPDDAVVVDVGAHSGMFSRMFAKMASRGTVYALEPSAYARSVLLPANRWNRIRNVQVVPMGLSDVGGVAVLHTPIKSRGGLGFGLAHLGDDTSEWETVPHQIELTTLDEIVKKWNLSRLDFIKMDIEGWEYNALQGGMETLHRFKPPIFMEIGDEYLARANVVPSQIWKLLEPLGYVATKILGHRMVSGYEGNGDYLWTPK
jgi:FkbM family methyltransferase